MSAGAWGAFVLFLAVPALAQTVLRPGQPIEKELAGGETDTYTIALDAGQYLHAVAMQKGVDVVVRLFGPDRKKLTEVDSPNGTEGPEPVFWIAAVSGDYTLEVVSLDKDAKPGRYELRVKELRAATFQDLSRVKAEVFLAHGIALQGQSTQASLEAAIDSYEKALTLFRQAKAGVREADVLKWLASARCQLHQFDMCADTYLEAAEVYRAAGDSAGEGAAYSLAGETYFQLKRFPAAAELFEKAVALYRQTTDRRALADALYNLALGYDQVDTDLTKSVGVFEEALAIYRERNALQDIEGTLISLGKHFYLTDPKAALSYYDRALPICREAKDRHGEAVTLANMGNADFALNRYEEARLNLEEAGRIYREIDEPLGLAGVLNSRGAVYEAAQVSGAIELYDQALTIYRANNDRADCDATLNNLGAAYRKQGRFQDAVRSYEEALQITREQKETQNEGRALTNLGLVWKESGDLPKAVGYFEQALRILSPAQDPAAVGTALNNMAAVYREQQHYDQAIDAYGRALAIFRKIPNKQAEAGTLSEFMTLWKQAGQPRLAVFFGKQAVNAYQEVRAYNSGMDREILRSFTEGIAGTYRALADLLIAQGRLPEAERVLGFLKDQEFSQFTRGDKAPGTDTRPLSLSAGETQADSITAGALEWFELRGKASRTPQEEARMAELSAKLNLANDAMNGFSRALEAALAKPSSSHAHDFASETSDSQSLLRDLGSSGTVIVYTVVLEEELDLIVVTPTIMVPHQVKIKRTELGAKVLALLAKLKDPDSDPRGAAADLYQALVAPIAADLEGARAKTIAWSLDGVLRYAPMSALFNRQTGRYLIEDYGSVLFNSANTSRLRDQPQLSHWTALGMGVSKKYAAGTELPPLSAVPLELDSVVHDPQSPDSSGPVPGRILLNDAFTKKAMEDQLWHKYPLVHIACHFVLDPGDDDRSWLLLGGENTGGAGYQLRLDELRKDVNLDFHNVELLTLSACETAVGGGASEGREVDGLGLLAQKKGAKAVVATLWAVDDDSTGRIMADFYRRWTQSQGVRKVEALREAQLAMLHDTGGKRLNNVRGVRLGTPTRAAKYSHPYFWAPFILMGNWQ
jgi:CHAT domain-containing protein/tetratricopeptide (TPR) repeat protein